MRIFITTMDDPVQTHDFIKAIIDYGNNNIVGLAVIKGDRLTIGKKKSKLVYILSLCLIMGVPYFILNSWKSLGFKLKRKLHEFGFVGNPSISGYAIKKGIPVLCSKSTNNKEFLEKLRSFEPDVIINQSQSIIKKEIL